MQAFRKLSGLNSLSGSGSLVSLQAAASTAFASQVALREYASDTKKVGKTETNWVSDGVNATVGTVTKKAKEAFGSQKKPGDETQEPAGVMENRDADESKQPQSRYKEVTGKAKEQWQDKKVTDLYQDANKNANATAESAKTKAKENEKAKS